MRELKNIDYLKNKILDSIKEFEIDNNIELRTDTQNSFTAALMYTGKKIFINDFFIVEKNKRLYDVVLIDLLSDYYIYLCMLYNKVVSINDFSYLLNISYRILTSWKNKAILNNNNYIDICVTDLYNIYNSDYDYYISIISLNNNNITTTDNNKYIIHCEDISILITAYKALIIQKLHETRENTLTNKLVSLNHPTGVLSVVNKEYSWNIQQIQKETAARSLSLSELPSIETLQ